MSLLDFKKPEQISAWVDYTHEEGLSFKIRGIKYKPYVVAHERCGNLLQSKGFDPKEATINDNTSQELVMTCVAYHLIEDWKGLTKNDNPVPFDKDLAKDMMLYGGANGVLLWHFITSEAERIQNEADGIRAEVMGKSETFTSGQNTQAPKQPRKKEKLSTQNSDEATK